jgi:hypothetical protein
MRTNPDELRAVASALRAARVAVEHDRASLSRAERVFERWRSPAADDVRTTLYPLGLTIVGFVVRDLDDLARTLDHLADELTDRLVQIRTVAANVSTWFARQSAPEDGGPPRWERERWRYRPGRLPPADDSAWLDARRYLRGFGVPV